MTKRNTDLTNEQELQLREFIDGCQTTGLALPPDFIFWAFERMGYRLLEKRPGEVIAIPAQQEVKRIFGDPDPYRDLEDHYVRDGEALREAAAGADDTDETSTSEPTESDSVGDVLQQDV